MKKRLKRYAVVPCIFIVVFVAVALRGYFKTANVATATLEVSYENASKSENPDGSHFSVVDFKSDAFLERIAENLSSSDQDIDTQELKQWFSVSPWGDYSEDYAATTYEVSVKTPLSSGVSAKELLDAFFAAYQQQYIEQSSLNTDFLSIDTQYLETLDFFDSYEYLSLKSKMLQELVKEREEESKAHITWANTETYQSLYNEIINYQTLSLENLKTYLEENRVYKDAEDDQEKLTYKRFDTYKKYVETKKQYDYVVSLLADYNIAMINPVMVPMYNEGKSYFYMSLSRIGTDVLGEMAAAMETSLRNLCIQLRDLDLDIDRTDSGIDTVTLRQEILSVEQTEAAAEAEEETETKEKDKKAEEAEETEETEESETSDIAAMYEGWDPDVQPDPGTPVESKGIDEAEVLLSNVCQQYNDLFARFECIYETERDEEYAHAFSFESEERSLMSRFSVKKAILCAFAASALVMLFVVYITKRAKKEI